MYYIYGLQIAAIENAFTFYIHLIPMCINLSLYQNSMFICMRRGWIFSFQLVSEIKWIKSFIQLQFVISFFYPIFMPHYLLNKSKYTWSTWALLIHECSQIYLFYTIPIHYIYDLYLYLQHTKKSKMVTLNDNTINWSVDFSKKFELLKCKTLMDEKTRRPKLSMKFCIFQFLD